MNKIITASLIAALHSTTYAANPVPGWYGSLLVGASAAPTNTFHFTQSIAGFSTVPVDLSLHYKYYVDSAITLGYRCDNYRLEGEALYNNNPLSKLVINGVTINNMNSSAGFRVKGGNTILGLMFNGYYDMNIASSDGESDWVPYIGLGLGYARVKDNMKFYYNNALIPGSQLSATNNAPAGQAILGTHYFMDDFWAVGLDYRYFTSKQIKNTHSKAQFQSVNLSVTGAFDSVLG